MGVNEGVGVNNENTLSPTLSQERGAVNSSLNPSFNDEELMQPENPQSQDMPPQNQPNFDVDTLMLLLNLLQKVNQKKGDKAKPEDFIKILESVLETAQEQEIE